MKLGVVIVTYNRLDLLKECIAACQNQTYQFNEIYIVNNKSTDGTKEYLDKLNSMEITVNNLDENLGGSYGFFEGVKYFSKNKNIDYVLLIDDDAIIDKNYNLNIVKEMEKKPKGIISFSGTVKTENIIQFAHRQHLNVPKKFIRSDSLLNEYNDEFFDYELSTFCGLYIPIEVVKKIGLPKKDFFIWLDDTEYCLRLIKYGKIRNVNSASLNHKTNLVMNSGYTWKTYYGLRNQIYILKKYYSRKQLMNYLFDMIKRIIGGKIYRIFKNDAYYDQVSKIYYDALKDGISNKFGKNDYYNNKFIIKKRMKFDAIKEKK